MPAYDYFDSSYFNDGQSKGTVYVDYLAVSRSSPIYAEIADAIAEVFKPRRVLELGCATGIIVRLLNEKGVEAHGIDVSQWAIDNREHHYVTLAGAEKLPYPDGHFDLVLSVHALEHIPAELAASAFHEIARVCPTGPQWHMLPIIGLGPYRGDRASVVAGLKKDPTHNLLEDENWWLARFADAGLSDSGLAVYLRTEAGSIDLSESQLVVAGAALTPETRRRTRSWNARVLASYHERALQSGAILSFDGGWKDLKFALPDLAFSPDLELELELLASEPMALRAVFLDRDAQVELDEWFNLAEGKTKVVLGPHMTVRRGKAEGAVFDGLWIGGKAQGTMAVSHLAIRKAGREPMFSA